MPLTLLYLEVIVGPWEERQLHARHGRQYLAYKQQVRKWIPLAEELLQKWETKHDQGEQKSDDEAPEQS